MTAAAWLQLLFLIGLLAVSTPLLGRYLARCSTAVWQRLAPGDRVFPAPSRA